MEAVLKDKDRSIIMVAILDRMKSKERIAIIGALEKKYNQ
jgi:hypothetical protein